MIIDHTNRFYTNIQPNGALIYSMNIVKNIIPNVKTDRNWVTIDCKQCRNYSIVFIHSNVNLEKYEYLKHYEDLILVTSQKTTQQELKKLGYADHIIFLPLSIDLDETLKYKVKEPHNRNGSCYAGRPNKPDVDSLHLHNDIVFLSNLTHADLLRKLNYFKKCYAVGLTAIEAKVMGCEIIPFDRRFPDASVWKIRDGKDMAKELQKKLDRIDKK